MRSRVLLSALALVVALAALALGRVPNRRPAAAGEGRQRLPRTQAPAPAPRAVDPDGIRDLFHSPEPSPRVEQPPPRATADTEQAAPEPPPGPRLVGLVSRGGRTVAALAVEGEVVLAGPGETVAGATVLAVDADGVRIRRADGTEETLALP